MVNYGNGKIYKIERISDNVLLYVGSTTKEYLSQRLVEHKRKATEYPNRKVYKSISDNEGWNNHQILLIKQYSCNSRDELKSEEARFIRCLKPYGNKQIPMRTDKQYRIDNKDTIHRYYETNKEIIKENRKQINNCCCGKIILISNKSRHSKSKKHINSIPVQFNIIEQMHNNRKQYIFPVLPTL